MAQLQATSIKDSLKIINDNNDYLNFELSNNDDSIGKFEYITSETDEENNTVTVSHKFLNIDNSGKSHCDYSITASQLLNPIQVKFNSLTSESETSDDFITSLDLSNVKDYIDDKNSSLSRDINAIKTPIGEIAKRINKIYGENIFTISAGENPTISAIGEVNDINVDLKGVQSSLNALSVNFSTYKNKLDILLKDFKDINNSYQPNSIYNVCGRPLICYNTGYTRRVAGLNVSPSTGKICVVSETAKSYQVVKDTDPLVKYKNKYIYNYSYKVNGKTKTGTIVSDTHTFNANNADVKLYKTRTNNKKLPSRIGYAVTALTTTASDIRLKTNIEDSNINGLNLINNIKLREFDWDGGKHQTIGFIADELEALDPQLADGGGYTEDGGMNIKTIEILTLQAYSVKAIQELSQENKQLKQQILDLESRISKLEK